MKINKFEPKKEKKNITETNENAVWMSEWMYECERSAGSSVQ